MATGEIYRSKFDKAKCNLKRRDKLDRAKSSLNVSLVAEAENCQSAPKTVTFACVRMRLD